MRIPIADIRRAFDVQLTDAPTIPQMPSTPDTYRMRRWGAFATGIGGGVAAGLLLALGLGFGAQGSKNGDWPYMVANYQSLYVPETLANGTKTTPDEKQQSLDHLSKVVGLDLTSLETVEGLQFRRAQQLGFNGEPLVQLAYQLPNGTPVAICILQSNDSQRPPKSGTLEGLAAIHWTTGQHGILVIGGDDQGLVDELAPLVQARI